MKRRFDTNLLHVCLLALWACDAGKPVGPFPVSVAPAAPTFELRPDPVEIGQGGEVQLWASIHNWRASLEVPSFTYSSNAPSIATVDTSGYVTAIAPGKATISATMRLGAFVVRDSLTVAVFTPTIVNDVVVRAQSDGWAPTPLYVAAGSTIEWRGGTIAVSGRPVETVYLLDRFYSVIDSLDLRGGSAKLTLNTRGAVRYCSNACWDPPEHGIIYVN